MIEYFSTLIREFIRQFKKSKQANEIDKYIMKAIKENDEKKLKEMVAKFLEIYPTSPKRRNYPRDEWAANIYYNVGTSCVKEKKFDLAIAMYDMAASYSPSSFVYNNMATCLKWEGRYTEAYKYLKKAISIDSDYVRGYGKMAIFLEAYKPPVEEDAYYYLEQYWKKGGDSEKLKSLVNTSASQEKEAVEKFLYEPGVDEASQ